MKIFLALIPIYVIALSFLLYRHNGKRELLKLDLVQFLFCFVFTPLVYVWLKTFFFFNIKNIPDLKLGLNGLFILDTAFTVLFLYIFAFVVIHTLTKSFHLKRIKDPLHDIFADSEYFHLGFSHVGVFSLGIISVLLISLSNIILPFPYAQDRYLYLGIGSGVIIGLISYVGIWTHANGRKKFSKFINFLILINSLLLISLYFVYRPGFAPEFLIFWCGFFLLLVMSLLTQVLPRSLKARNLVLKLRG